MRSSQPCITPSDMSPARKPGMSSTGIPSPRATPSPRKTGSTSSRASSACQRISASGRPHQRRGSAGGSAGTAGSSPVSSRSSVTRGRLPRRPDRHIVRSMPMDLAPSERAAALRDDLLAFMDAHVYPAEPVYERQIEEGGDPHKLPPVVEELKAEARRRGLWNPFLPDEQWGAGLSNLDYAHLAEVMGRSPHIAPEATNCGAPDTGNMEVLAMFGTPEQQERWLAPLLEGEIRSCFAMTEPEVASSDATNISGSIRRDGDEYVVDTRKWFITGAADERCKVALVL